MKTENIISLENITKQYPDKILWEESSFGIHKGDKIGLMGVNGCGKTTFLKILTGKEHPDSGTITVQNNLKIGYLCQIPELDQQLSIYEQIYHSDNPEFQLLREYNKLIETASLYPHDEFMLLQQKLMDEMERKQVWGIEVRAKSVLNRLGFDDITKKIATLSGGQKRRVDLAQVIIDEPDLLILDEPTNHLDMDTIEWLQEFLINFKGTIIFVTHDRYFLDAVSNMIMEIDSGKIRFYEGNYSYYLERKQLELVDLQRKETRRKAQLSKELKWLNRGAKARATKPKDHIERVKELIDKSYLTENQELDISFQTKRFGKTILEIKNITFGYDKPLLKNFSHVFQKFERIGVIGKNGCGKTSLLKTVLGELEPLEGNIKVGANTVFSYYRQEDKDMDPKLTVLEYIQQQAEFIRTKDGVQHSASDMLDKFLFSGKTQYSKLGSLSGGEKKRLNLLRSLMFGSNFIILDEPTNDLDIRTLEILEDYLDAYDGCLLVVSHDRFLLDRVTDFLFIFEEGNGVRKFPGNYSDYLLVKRYYEEEKERKPEVKREITRAVKKMSYKDSRELELVHQKIEELEGTKLALNNKLATESATLTLDDYSAISNQLNSIEDELIELLIKWEELESKV